MRKRTGEIKRRVLVLREDFLSKMIFKNIIREKSLLHNPRNFR